MHVIDVLFSMKFKKNSGIKLHLIILHFLFTNCFTLILHQDKKNEN